MSNLDQISSHLKTRRKEYMGQKKFATTAVPSLTEHGKQNSENKTKILRD